MSRNLFVKLGAIALLMVLLLIPLLMIGSLIGDRQAKRNGVLEEIARGSSFSQRLTGPILVVPYRKTVTEWHTDEKTNERTSQIREVNGRLYFLPDTFTLDGNVHTEQRSRGIYEARLFNADTQLQGSFHLPAQWGLGDDFKDYRFDTAYLAVGISDVRGIKSDLKLQLNGQGFDFKPGTLVPWLGDGVYVDLPAVNGLEATNLQWSFNLALQGTGQLEVVPVGSASTVNLKSDWPHPSFFGNYLPAERDVTADGFSASWQTTFFATNLQQTLEGCATNKECMSEKTFGVSFIQPVDQYLKSDRAIKYALLFISLTFAGFFLFEVLKRIAVHPIQYGLVGMALALFFLLLLSLAEHIGFALAYGVSASACVVLIGAYISSVLRSLANALWFCGGLTALYGALYVLLSAEDYALLMGACLLFGLLGVFMMLTRKLDWYSIGKPLEPDEVAS